MIDAVVDSKSNFTRAKTQAKHWAAWFSPLKDSSMKQTNLNIFYHLGDALSGVGRVSTGMAWFDYWILMEEADQWLLRFLMEITSVPLPDTRAAANKLLDAILA